jgi:hypothetical protein
MEDIILHHHSLEFPQANEFAPLDFKCATCSSGAGDLDLVFLRMMVIMGTITSLSFVWFISGAI